MVSILPQCQPNPGQKDIQDKHEDHHDHQGHAIDLDLPPPQRCWAWRGSWREREKGFSWGTMGLEEMLVLGTAGCEGGEEEEEEEEEEGEDRLAAVVWRMWA